MVIQYVLQMSCLAWLTKTWAAAVAASLAKPGCHESCGEVTNIPYPFGIGANCSMNDWFRIYCDDSYSPPKPFLWGYNNISRLEVLNISLLEGTLRVNNPVLSSNCGPAPRMTSTAAGSADADLGGSPFFFSSERNRFTGVGCESFAVIKRQDKVISGCVSICPYGGNVTTGDQHGCSGLYCCQTTIPPLLKFINASIESLLRSQYDRSECTHAFMVDQDWFLAHLSHSDPQALAGKGEVPVVLDWGLSGDTCHSQNDSLRSDSDTPGVNMSGSSCGANAHCSRNESSNYLCFCDRGYEGNPYLPQGCRDIDECASPYLNHCKMYCWNSQKSTDQCDGNCRNTNGSYECDCPAGFIQLGQNYCYKLSYFQKKSRLKVAVLGIGIGLGTLILIIGMWWLYKIIKRRQKTKLKEKFFKRNGGLILQQQLSSHEGNVDNTKLFTSKELEKATDRYNENRILGQGGQGTVYKGMLTDGRIVAVKKSKVVGEDELDQFINEVVILSQINHRNVVKLLGCCLETEVPLLVYEFIPNGTLFQLIHDQNEEFPFSWEMRLRIAMEVAGALSYLHSAASIPIYHRDIKSTNILLDEKYRAKVADFGTSRTIAIDQTHLTTLPHGTFGYVDPEYFQSNQFTEKSDVYSFAVVLVELLTGQKPISSIRSQEERSLAVYFILSMKENRLFDIVDARIATNDGGKEEILAVANLAKRCLNLNGKKRPTMKEVSAEFEGIRKSQGTFTTQNEEEVEYDVTELTGPWDAASTSASLYSNNNKASSLDVQPLLSS